MVEEAVEQPVESGMPLGELLQPAVADRACRDLRGEVAEQLVWDADVRAEDLVQRLHRLAAVDELEPREAETLLEDLGRVARDRAGHAAADIPVVRDRDGEAQES